MPSIRISKGCPSPNLGDTPSFPVENWKEKLRVFKDAQVMKESLRKILGKSDLKEHFSKGTIGLPQEGMVGWVRFLWNPHNFRLKIKFRVQNKLILKKLVREEIKRVRGSLPLEEVNVYQGGAQAQIYKGRIIIEINPSCVVLIWEGKEWFNLAGESFSFIIDEQVARIKGECLHAVESLGLRLELDLDSMIWLRQENTLKGDEFLDSLPRDLIVDDTSFKKVYPGEFEFKDAGFLKNYVKNRVLEEVAPLIAKELAEIKARIPVIPIPLPFSRLSGLVARISSPTDVLALEPEILLLSDSEKALLTDWIFLSDCGRGR